MKFISPQHALTALRLGVSIIMMLHGLQRFYYGTINDFGAWLNSRGFLIGVVLAWTITLFEVIGGALLAAGYFKRIICLAWMFNLIMGIVLVHLPNGWFVVGPGSGGVEYSFLLLLSLLVIASQEKS
jgi:putative oxidoreductase